MKAEGIKLWGLFDQNFNFFISSETVNLQEPTDDERCFITRSLMPRARASKGNKAWNKYLSTRRCTATASVSGSLRFLKSKLSSKMDWIIILHNILSTNSLFLFFPRKWMGSQKVTQMWYKQNLFNFAIYLVTINWLRDCQLPWDADKKVEMFIK